MPLIGCRRKFIQDHLEKPNNICNLEKVKIHTQESHIVQVQNTSAEREKEPISEPIQRTIQEISHNVNWGGEDQDIIQDYKRNSGIIYFPSQMIQQQVCYQWPTFQFSFEDPSKSTQSTQE